VSQSEVEPVRWMWVKEYDFNNGTGHFAVRENEVVTDDGRWPEVGDSMILATVADPSDSFGCVVTVTKIEPAVRDGWLRYETDLSARSMAERRRRDVGIGARGQENRR
jgi:hypothetical protein